MNAIIEALNAGGARSAAVAAPMLMQSTVLIALLFALDLVLRKRVRATIRYGIWMLALAKLLLPPSLALPTGAAYWLPAQAAGTYFPASHAILTEPVVVPKQTIANTISTYKEAGAIREPVASVARLRRLSLSGVLFAAWVAVVSGMALWVAARLRRVVGVIGQSTEAPESVPALLESCRRQLGIKRAILSRCAPVGSPAICGVLRPLILIPEGLAENLSAAEMRSVLLHELAHFKRGDLWVNHAQILLQIVYWYNPMLWLANARIRRAREEAVDEMVLVEMSGGAQAYSETLLRVAKLGLGRPISALGFVGILEPGKGLAQRILHIMNRPLPRTARIGARALAAVLLLALVALPMAGRSKTAAAPGQAASESAPNHSGVSTNAILLTISSEGTLTLQGEFVTAENLEGKLAEASHHNPNTTLMIRAGSKASAAQVINAIDAAKVAHIDSIAARVEADPARATPPRRLDWHPSLPMLTPAEVTAMREKLAQDPEDLATRRDLLIRFFARAFSPDDQLDRRKNVLWFIEHHPELVSYPYVSLNASLDGSAYDQGRDLWLKHVRDNPTNTVILANVAAYFTTNDRETAEDLMKKAQGLDPQNPAWPERLGQLYKLDTIGQSGTNFAAMALAEFEKAQALTSPPVPGFPGLADLAQMAFAAGDLKKARGLCQ